MHTIGRMVVKYTRLGMGGNLLFLKYCCFISGTGKREKLHVSPGALVYSQISLSRKLKIEENKSSTNNHQFYKVFRKNCKQSLKRELMSWGRTFYGRAGSAMTRAVRSWGKLTALWDVIRQMHTIGRMLIIYTTLGTVGHLLLWKYYCFIFGTENN